MKPWRRALVVFQPAGESVTRLAALRSLDRLGGLTPDEIAMLCLDSSPLIRDEADRLSADLEKKSLHSGKPIALSNLLQSKQFPTTVFDNLVDREIILSLSQKVQPLRELAEQIGRSPTTVRRHLALLQNGTAGGRCFEARSFSSLLHERMGESLNTA